jgi:hypothetical protein
MAKLIIQTEGFGGQVIDLKLGLNRLGRAPSNDFQVEHATVSTRHCEITLAEGMITVQDCDSTNGTFVDGRRITTARLTEGQVLSLGDVSLLVESTAVNIAIPHFDVPRPAPPVVLADGAIICPRHPRAKATHQCTHCKEILCETCVHRLRRRGGKVLNLCPICSYPVKRIGEEPKKKKGFLGFLRKTVKLPFVRGAKNGE